MTKPVRIQRKRTKGWKMPPNTANVTRPGPWGNYAAIRAGTPKGQAAVDAFETWVDTEASSTFKGAVKSVLRGQNLACYCHLCERHKDGKPLGVHCTDCDPCHADVLLEIANAPVTREDAADAI